MAKIFKRKYKKKLMGRLTEMGENRAFLLKRLKREWEEVEKTIERDRKRQKLYDTAKEYGEVLGLTLLAMAAVCGVLIIGAVAPNIFSAFGRFGSHRRYFDKNSFQDRVYYYKRRGYIKVKRDVEDKTLEIKLTKKGEEKLISHTLGNLKISPQKKWDGIWRIVIFDIPEKNKWSRDGVRECLKRMGFYPLQKSTFATPHPCAEEIGFLGRLYNAENHIRLIETSNISFDGDLRDFFGLLS